MRSLLAVLGAVLLVAACATTPSPDAPRPPHAASDPGPPPIPLPEVDYRPIEVGFSEKIRFERDEPRVLVNLDPTRFRAFGLPASPRPLRIGIESYTSYEVPGYPVKYLFCPRIVLLDPDFEIVHSSGFGDVETTTRLFGDPRFEIEYLLPRGSTARYLLVVRESAFDGQTVESNQEAKSGLYDSQGRMERERIHSSRTGRLRLSVGAYEE